MLGVNSLDHSEQANLHNKKRGESKELKLVTFIDDYFRLPALCDETSDARIEADTESSTR